ncbi:mechanosensitive ion channel protein MscS [Halorubrum sp. C3]|nr:mechanosensitive ion channel protein MscS [Halorubrum sp. C3]
MTGWIGVVTELQRALAGNFERFAASVGIVAAVVTVRFLTGRLKHGDRDLTSTQRLLLSATVGVATAVGALTLIAVWDRSGALFKAAQSALTANQVSNVVLAVILLAIAYALTDFLGGVIREIGAESASISQHQQEVILRVTQLTVYTSAILAVVGLFTENVGSLLVGAGFLGIVVGMAARQTLGSLLAGFVLMFSRPFEIGDWVEIGSEEGFVTDITIMNTHMRNFDGEYVVVPNDLVANQAITNRSREGRLRIHMEVGIGYDDDPDEAAGIAEDVLSGIDTIANNPQPYAIPSGFGDSAILLDLRFWIDPPTPQARWRSKATAVEEIQDRFADAGISIPYPQRTVSYPPETAEADETVERVERADESVDGRPRDGSV